MSSENKVDDGGPAFPSVDYTGGIIGGMTLRDWFAGQALTNIVHNGATKIEIAEACYDMADAMLKARTK